MKTIVKTVFALALAGGIAQADIITTYNFKGELGSQSSTAASNVAAGLVASAISRGTGLTANAGADSINSQSWTTGVVLDANDYYTFTLTPQSSFMMTLENIALSERRSLTGIREWSLRSSLDGFGSSIATVSVPDDDLVRSHTVTLGAAFVNLTSNVAFRIFGYKAESGAGTWRITNTGTGLNTPGLTVNGSVSPFPEPSTLTLMGIGIATSCLFGIGARLAASQQLSASVRVGSEGTEARTPVARG